MQTNEEVVYLYLDDIIPNRFQPREVFDERPLKELAVSIKEHGVIQPIIVRKVNDKYEIIAGERRYKASALAGLTKIPAIIRNLDDKETSKVALLENLQRKNLNPIEEAKTYQKILELDEMTQEELAKTMGKSQSAVANKLRLLVLPEEVQEALLKENISERHARTLLNLKTADEQKQMLSKIVENKMTVRQLEDEIKGKEPKIEIPEAKDIPSEKTYIPINPIMPNFNGENTNVNTPILTNIPSVETMDTDSQENKPKFINFGELRKVNEDEEKESSDGELVDINQIKSQSTDINILNNGDQSLDNLLRIDKDKNDSNQEKTETNDFKFFSPAREAIKQSEQPQETQGEDYFTSPDLISVNLPDSVQTSNINGITLKNNDGDETPDKPKNDLNTAIEIIRNSINKIENIGMKIEKDELDLENSYQIVIKIEK